MLLVPSISLLKCCIYTLTVLYLKKQFKNIFRLTLQKTPPMYKNKISLNPQNTCSFMRVFTVYSFKRTASFSRLFLECSITPWAVKGTFSIWNFVNADKLNMKHNTLFSELSMRWFFKKYL